MLKMLRCTSVVSLLVLICSAYAYRYPAASSFKGEIARFTQSNATLQSISEELGIMNGEIGAQYTSPLYGGGGGSAFNSQVGAVKTINIRSGSLIDSIELVYENGQSSGVYGGNGGTPSSFNINIAAGEHVVAILGSSGSKIDSLTFVTNTGRIFGPLGGSGGSPFHVSQCNLNGVFGRSGSLIDAVGFYC